MLTSQFFFKETTLTTLTFSERNVAVLFSFGIINFVTKLLNLFLKK